MSSTPRRAYFIPVDQHDENGYIPSVVTEGQWGHSPMTGNGPFASPWYWGETYEAAKEIAAQANAELGLTPDDVTAIIASSMGDDPCPCGISHTIAEHNYDPDADDVDPDDSAQ